MTYFPDLKEQQLGWFLNQHQSRAPVIVMLCVGHLVRISEALHTQVCQESNYKSIQLLHTLAP